MASSAGEVADQPPGLAPGELGDVGVLLLRHDRRAGGPRVVEHGPAELPRGPQADLLAQPGEVHADHRRDEEELGDEVTIADRVDGVGDRASEAQLGGDRLRVERKGGSGQRPGAQRRERRPDVPVGETVEVAAERVRVLGQLVPEGHRLGVLQVGEAGSRAVDVGLGLVGQRDDQVDEGRRDGPGPVAQVEAEVGGHLVVAAAPGAQLPADRAEQLEEAALDRRVDVLVRRAWPRSCRRRRVPPACRARPGPDRARGRRAAPPCAGPRRAHGSGGGRRAPAASRSAPTGSGRPSPGTGPR